MELKYFSKQMLVCVKTTKTSYKSSSQLNEKDLLMLAVYSTNTAAAVNRAGRPEELSMIFVFTDNDFMMYK